MTDAPLLVGVLLDDAGWIEAYREWERTGCVGDPPHSVDFTLATLRKAAGSDDFAVIDGRVVPLPDVTTAVSELRAVHHPTVDGRLCEMCGPGDGSWPCVSRQIADELDRETHDA